MLNIRLTKALEKKLADYSERMHQTKSEVVKEALVEYLSKAKIEQSPFTIGEDLFGKAGSDRPDASTTYKSTLKKKLSEKYAH